MYLCTMFLRSWKLFTRWLECVCVGVFFQSAGSNFLGNECYLEAVICWITIFENAYLFSSSNHEQTSTNSCTIMMLTNHSIQLFISHIFQTLSHLLFQFTLVFVRFRFFRFECISGIYSISVFSQKYLPHCTLFLARLFIASFIYIFEYTPNCCAVFNKIQFNFLN